MEEQANILLKLLLKVGRMFLENGAATYRAEKAILCIFNGAYEGEIEVFALPTVIIVDLYMEGKHYSGISAIKTRTINLGNIETINDISRSIACGKLNEELALIALNNIGNKRKKAIIVCSAAAAAGVFALFFGGGIKESLIAAFSCALVQIISFMPIKAVMVNFLMCFLGGLVPAFFASALSAVISTIDVTATITGAMLPFFPGVAMINAVHDTINGDLVSGVARAAEALLSAVGLAIGVMVGLTVMKIL